MKLEIKNALENYFDKQRGFWQSSFGTFPQKPYDEKCEDNPTIIPNTLDEEDYVQWHPVEQTPSIDFSKLEQKLNCMINPKIKQLFTSYWYYDLVGVLNNVTVNYSCIRLVLYFVPIPYGIEVLELLEDCYNYADSKFHNKNIHFEIGIALVGGDDSYLLYIDNETTMVKCVQISDQIVIEVGFLEDVLSNMDVGV